MLTTGRPRVKLSRLPGYRAPLTTPAPAINFHLSLNGSGTPDSSPSSAAADGTSPPSPFACAAAGHTLALNITSGKITPRAILAVERRPCCASDCRAQGDSARFSCLGKRKSFIDSAPLDNIGG